MKILHILDHSIPLHSGYTFRTRAILREQQARGWQTAQVTSTKQGVTSASEETIDSLKFFRTPVRAPKAWPLLNQLEVINATARRVAEVIDIERPDILHAHSPALIGLAALRAARKARLPLVYEIRAFWEDAAVDHGTAKEWGLRYRLTRRLETHVIRRADAVTTICEGLRSDIVGRGIDPAKVTVIPNAVDIDAFPAAPPADPVLAGQLGVAGRTVLGFIGSFYAYEGLALAIQALPDIAARHDVALLLVGGGPQETELKRLAAASPVAGRIVFVGRVPHADVTRYYALIDVLLYPRLPMRLTELVTPLKPLEAMALHKLFIASDVGGHRELIRDGETGILFRSGDAAALTRTVDALLNDPGQSARLKENGRRFVETERAWRNSVARYAPVYDGLLNAQGSAAQTRDAQSG